MAVKNIILKNADGDYVIPYVGIPSQTGNAGKVLGTNGESLDFVEKQDTISDLAAIRSGATLGATSVQPGDLATKQDQLTSANAGKDISITEETGGGEETKNGISPVSLENVTELNYIKALGATEQRNLPSGYTQLEYIESTGTQYIDTGIVPTNTTEVFVRFYVPSVNVLDRYVFQSRTTGSSNVRYGARIQDGSLNVFFGNFAANIYSTPISIGWHTLKITPQSFILDDTTEVPITQSFTDTMGTFKLFCYGNAAGGFWGGRISEFVADGKRLLPAVKSNVLGMYDTESGQFLTNAGTGDFTAGANAVPTPDNPMDIICNNGVLKYGQYGKNLFDKNNTQMAKEWRVENNGKVYRDIGSQTIVIPVQPNTTYTVQADLTGYNQSSPPVGRIVFFTTYPVPDTTVGTVHTQVGSKLPYTFTTGNNTAYVAIWLNRTGNIAQQVWDSAQLEVGSTATDYEPYHFGIHTDGTQETVTVTGKNLFDKDDTVVGYLTDQGVLVQNNTGKTSGLIKVKSGAVYTLKLYRSSQQILTRVCSYDSDGNFVSLLVRDPTTAIGYNIDTFTADTEYVRISFHTDSTEVQLELGSTPTDYEPYYNGGTANAEMLLKVGTYQDNQELLTGNITRNVGIKVLDGTESWNKSPTESKFWYQNSDMDYLHETRNSVHKCNYYQSQGQIITVSSINNGYVSFSHGNEYRLYIGDNRFTTVADFKQYLAGQYANGTPVIVVYPIATPTTETVSGQSLTASGNCTVTATGSLDNLELEVGYSTGSNVLTISFTNDSGYITSSELSSYALKADLNGKADADLSNINTSGKSFASSLAMPSSKYIDLTLGASGSTYTAPANGWILCTLSVQANGYIRVQNFWAQSNNVDDSYVSIFYPITKGESVSIEYTKYLSTIFFRFIYAEGEENV